MGTRARTNHELQRLRGFLDEERAQLALLCRDRDREVSEGLGLRIADAGDLDVQEALEAAREAWQAGARAQARAIEETWRAIFSRIGSSLEPSVEENGPRPRGLESGD